jgi:hypothetical protein
MEHQSPLTYLGQNEKSLKLSMLRLGGGQRIGQRDVVAWQRLLTFPTQPRKDLEHERRKKEDFEYFLRLECRSSQEQT